MFLWVRALTYMLMVGGGWLVAIPATMLYFEQGGIWPAWRPLPLAVLASVAFLTGTTLALLAGYHLVVYGRGTPFPLDPTRRLVTSGPYRFIRNPQGVAMLLTTVAVVLSIRSAILWVLIPLTLIYLEAIVGPLEDKKLHRDFGDEYLEYRKRVRKWIPYFSITRTPRSS